MATMMKPREKSKKAKVKQRTEVSREEEVPEERSKGPNSSQHTDRIEIRPLELFEESVVSPKDIVSHECRNIADMPDDCQVNASQAVALSEEKENISIHEEMQQSNASPPAREEDLSPTAPPTEIVLPSPTAVTVPKALNVQYPNLSTMQHVETKSPVVYQKSTKPTVCLTDSPLKPFSEEQLKQFYQCAELELVKQFELEFLMNSLLETHEGDALYEALLEYYSLQCKLAVNLQDVKKYRKDALEKQEDIWIKEPITKTFTARCADNIEVKEMVTYNLIKVSGGNLEAASASLTTLFELVCYTYTTNLITAKIVKTKIDQLINAVLSYPQLIALTQNSQAALHKTFNPQAASCITNLRRAISILFSFLRRLSPSKSFDADLKLWLRKLVSLHLLVATKEDHWFLLFNILRCPNGVGNWATQFLQIPCETLSQTPTGSSPSEKPLQLRSAEMNHCIATLQILLLPIKKRNEYLRAFTQSIKEICDPVKDENWILIDSDGEDSHTPSGDCVGLKESDLIALLNQMPFEKLFMSALNVEKFLNDYIIEADLISSNRMLNTIAFSNKLVEIFGEGMLTYNTERYKQLAKRLGRLVRHILQYISDYHDLFLQNNVPKDAATCERIAVELNALLIKACSYIYRARNLATWQYFSSLPFLSLSKETLWQIFYYLNIGFPTSTPTQLKDHMELLNAPDFWKKFNVANADSSPEDLYYLLQAFFEMANERDKTKDWNIIKTICLHIFYIGYINEPTRDICYKASRDMLVNMALSYEDLMTCLLLQLKCRFSEIENSAYLFKSLPLENWKPDMDSFEILSNWLLHFDFQSHENLLARIIISHLNWGFDSDGRLYLPHNIHVRMACLLSESLTKHAPEVVGLSGISEGVRQVSSLIDFKQSTREQFTTWCWSMVSVLRLHMMDLSKESIKRTLQNPTQPLLFIPELERIDSIYQGVSENRPLAIYVGILVSLHGHSIPLICQKGFDLLKLLLNDYRYAAVVRCIELIVPLFLETPETLANCESFHGILNGLLNADKTYLKMAKDILYPNCVGPVLELLDNMIHHQITTYTDFGLSTPLNLINVWLNCLTALPNWQNSNVVYLLDKVLRVAYQFPDARLQAVEYFYNYFKDCDDWKGVNKKSAFKTLFGSNQSRIPTLSPYHGWLALVLLEIEFKTQDAHYWKEFIRQLSKINGNATLENALKQTTTIVKVPALTANMLVIYKYANLLATMDVNHPALPIISQKFFELYLSRVPMEEDEHRFGGVCGVADKFYNFNIPLMKKIKTNLKAAELHFSNESTKQASDESLSYFYSHTAKLIKSYLLWLEETSLDRLTKDQCNFPPQYNNEKLREILYGNTPHWTEYIYLPAIRKDQRYQAEQWARKCFRLKSTKHLRTPLQPKEKSTAVERIKRHLSSYDKPLEAPKYVSPKIVLYSEVTGNTENELKNMLKTLNSRATKFHFETSELNSLNRNFLDTVVLLYKMVPYEEIKIKSCNSLLFNRQCTNPARITTVTEHIRKDAEIERKVEKYHDHHDKIIDGMITQNVEDFVQCIGHLGDIMSLLKSNTEKRTELVTNTGIHFFYNVIENMTDITMKFPPTNDLYTQMLNELGIFIQENQEQQGLTVLELALKRPDLIKVLAGSFVPYRTRPEYFIKMYKFLVDSYLKRCDTKILFVLLSKFDLATWLDTYHPKLYDMSQLLQLVLRGLECWSQPDSTLLQDQFRRHLVHIFNFDFPQHYGEVIQRVLDCISEQKLMPIVLLDLLNSILARFKCETLNVDTKSEQIEQIAADFASRQNLFNLKAATDTIMLFARHFQKERAAHGLHGLYPKHKDYCKPLSMWFSCFGHVVVVTAISSYQSLLADQISDIIFGSIIEMYSPWLVIYTAETVQQQPANWIRQLKEKDQALFPWSEQHEKTSKIIIAPFINTLSFILDNLPISDIVLSHTFGWYVHHFGVPKTAPYIYAPIHEGISFLPWERFKPQPNCIDMLYDSLQKFIPALHAMLGHIFLRVNWNAWFSDTLPTLAPHVQTHVVSRLFSIFVTIAFEPNIHIHINTSKILEDAINYPWYMVEYAELENLFKWFHSVVDPAIIMKLPSETNYADRAVLELLRLASAMMPEMTLYWKATLQPNSNASAKRILFTRSYMRLLRLCATKKQKLLSTKDGMKIFNATFMELLDTMDKSLTALTPNRTLEEQKREALNLMVEIILPMQTQGEEASNLLINTLILWQGQCPAANLLMLISLEAIGHSQTFIGGIYALLESSIVYYFRTSEESRDWHEPTWMGLLRMLKLSLEKLELMPLLRNPDFFTLHIFILFKLEKCHNLGDKVTFLQDLSQLVENLKTCEVTEPRLAIVWGLIISRGCKILSESEHAKKPLLMLAHHLHITSKQQEGWGENLLGAIGFRKDYVTNKRKVLARCLACVVFSLFPITSGSESLTNQEYEECLQEVKMLLANKKFADMKSVIVKAVSILEEQRMPVLRDVPHLICRLIALFYVNSFLTTIPEIWDFDFKLT